MGALATAAAAAAIPSHRPPRNQILGRGRHNSKVPLTPPPTRPPRTYCYGHGYDTHSGLDCHKMRYGPAEQDFNDAARKAVDHTTVSGGSTTRL